MRCASSRTEHVQGRSLGDDPAFFQQEQPRAQRDGLGRTVGDIEHRDRQGTLDRAKPLEERVAVGQVEGGDRLVAEQEPGAGRQRACQADPLPLAAGERLRTALEQMLHAAERGHLGQPGARLVARPTLETEANIGGDVQMGKQPVVLKDHADPSVTQRLVDPMRGVEEGRPFESNLTHLGRGQSRDQPQRSSCRLPTARTRRRSRGRAGDEHRAKDRDGPGGPRERPGSSGSGSLTA